ncbi:MAG: hypothetical protein KBT68_12710 [bacterium]|nr:hypothetical protein [Candidatus Colisoma equi]
MKPFKYGCVVGADFFCPRPALQNRPTEYVRDGQNVVLVGERRMGKTSLVFAACKALKGYRMLYVDLLNIRTVSDLCNRVATAAAQMGKKASFGSRALSFISRLRPTLSVDPENGMPVISVDTRTAEDPRSVSDVVSLIERFAREERMFVVFDEFQEVRKLDACDQVLALLRSRIQLLQDTCFVFSGSVRADMVSIFTDPASAFYKSALTLEVSSIPDDDFIPFLIRRFASGKRKASADFVRRILDFTNRTTGDVQQLCAAVWSVTEDGQSLQETDIAIALKDIFATEGGQFEFQTAKLTRYQLRALIAIAKFGGERVYSSEFLSRAEMPSTATLTKALRRLTDDRLIYNYRKSYRFFNPFLRAWLVSSGF